MYSAQTLVNNIKKEAKLKNILIRDMLEECDLNVNSLSQISDKKGLSSFSLARIADCLGVSTDYLLGRTAVETVSAPDLTADEARIISAYRSNPVAVQDAVRRALGVE